MVLVCDVVLLEERNESTPGISKEEGREGREKKKSERGG